MWFAQVETQFALAGVTTEDTKFNYVAGNFDSKYAIEVRDILTSPPDNGKYTKLKSELIRRLSASQDQKTRRLLEREEIGDRTPSQFLRYLRGLAGTIFSDDSLRSLWLGRYRVRYRQFSQARRTCHWKKRLNSPMQSRKQLHVCTLRKLQPWLPWKPCTRSFVRTAGSHI